MNKPLVSVIIPTFNRAAVIERCVTSVLEQTYSEFRLIIVDDGSSDQTEEVVRRIEDHRLLYIQLSQNCGAAHARNVGLSYTNTPYVAFLDSDDVWLPHWLEKHLEEFSKLDTSYAAVTCGVKRIFDDGRVISSTPSLSGDVYSYIIKNGHTGIVNNPSTLLLRTSAVEMVGGWDESLPAAQDADLWLRIFRQYKLGVTPNILVMIYMDRADRIGRNYGRLMRGQFLLLKKHWRELHWRRRVKMMRSIFVTFLRRTRQTLIGLLRS